MNNPDLFYYLLVQSDDKDMKRLAGGCCGVVAVTLCTGAPFKEVWECIRKRRGAGPRWRGYAQLDDLRYALKHFGTRWVEESPPYVNLTNWVDQHAVKSQIYLVRTGRHFQTVLEGHVIDQYGDFPIHQFWGRRKMVSDAWRVKR